MCYYRYIGLLGGLFILMEAKKNFIINVIFYAIIIAIAYLIVQYVIPVLTPFITAFVIVWIMKGPADYIAKKTPFSEKQMRMVMVFLFYVGIVFLVMGSGVKIVSKIGELGGNFPQLYNDRIVPIMNEAFRIVEQTMDNIDPIVIEELKGMFADFIQTMGQFVSKVSVQLVKIVSNYASQIPSLFIKLIIMIISSFFIAADYDKLMAFLHKILPEKLQNGIRTIKKYGANVLTQYLKSYFLIFCVTYIELCIGLFILKIPYVGLVSFVISIFDILPILGLGGVLIPWSIICLIMKKYMLALGIILLYIIITVIRNIIEPKIIGMQIGLHPLATLIGMFVGLRLFGIIGLFGIPITLSIGLQLYKKGLIRLPKRKEKLK